MKLKLLLTFPVLIATCAAALAQAPASPSGTPYQAPSAANPEASRPPDPSPVPLDFVPQALDHLSAQAASKTSFAFDRSMLAVASGLIAGSDDDTRRAIADLDGVSVHILKFAPNTFADPLDVDAIREAYHLRGWKHVITTSATHGGPIQDGTTDVWVVLDGANVRGAVVLVDSPSSLTLATVAGNLSPEDLLHLRGHFGIPRFDADKLQKEKDRQIQ